MIIKFVSIVGGTLCFGLLFALAIQPFIIKKERLKKDIMMIECQTRCYKGLLKNIKDKDKASDKSVGIFNEKLELLIEQQGLVNKKIEELLAVRLGDP